MADSRAQLMLKILTMLIMNTSSRSCVRGGCCLSCEYECERLVDFIFIKDRLRTNILPSLLRLIDYFSIHVRIISLFGRRSPRRIEALISPSDLMVPLEFIAMNEAIVMTFIE